jgi:hypothetical protein
MSSGNTELALKLLPFPVPAGVDDVTTDIRL